MLDGAFVIVLSSSRSLGVVFLSSEISKVVGQELSLRLQAESIRSLNIVKANRASVLAAGALIGMVGQNLEAFMLDVSKVRHTEFNKVPGRYYFGVAHARTRRS